MKVCISATGNDLSAAVDPRFGRCQVFLFCDTESGACEAVPNPAMSAGGGAGTQAAQLVAERGATAVLTGNVGPNAYNALSAAGVTIYTGVSGTCAEALERLRSGELTQVTGPTAGRHSGMGGGGMGGGRGGR